MFFFSEKDPDLNAVEFVLCFAPNFPIYDRVFLEPLSLRERCPYSEFFWFVSSHIWTGTERYGVSLRIHSECGKIRTRKTPNTDTFHAVYVKVLLLVTFLEAEIFKLVKTYWIPNIIFLKGCS